MMRYRGTASGYTLVELLSVIIIIGVLAVAVLPRFAGVEVFASRGFFETALAATRYARSLATTSGCSIQVHFDDADNRIEISRWTGADCNDRSEPEALVAQPGSDTPFVLVAPSGVDVADEGTFYFDRVGRPHTGAGVLITSAAALQFDIGDRRLQVVPETGLAVED